MRANSRTKGRRRLHPEPRGGGVYHEVGCQVQHNWRVSKRCCSHGSFVGEGPQHQIVQVCGGRLGQQLRGVCEDTQSPRMWPRCCFASPSQDEGGFHRNQQQGWCMLDDCKKKKCSFLPGCVLHATMETHFMLACQGLPGHTTVFASGMCSTCVSALGSQLCKYFLWRWPMQEFVRLRHTGCWLHVLFVHRYR